MIHYLDISKASKQDEGLIRCIAKNIMGEKEVHARLRVNPKADYRSVLKSAKTGEPVLIGGEQEKKEEIVELPCKSILKKNLKQKFIKILILCLKKKVTEEERKVLDRLTLLKPMPKQQKIQDDRFGPKFSKQLEPIQVSEGIVVVLKVEFTSNPASEVIWYKDGFQMQSSEDFFIETSATMSSLRIREAFKSDSGMYQVKLFNEVGVAQSKAYLTVTPIELNELTPRILQEIKSVTTQSGETIKFQSRVVGNPHPVITWFKDDEHLEPNPRYKELKEDDTYTLLILETLAADSGCYECVAENGHGKVYTRAFLTVLGDKQTGEPEPVPIMFDQNNVRALPLSSKFNQPVIEQKLNDQVAREGSSVTFETNILHSDRKIHLYR
jgi:hypothetical protein